MPYLPDLTELNQTRAVIETFGGYNHNLRIGDGEWYNERNLTAAHFPMFSQRKKRGVYHTGLAYPMGLAARDALAWVDGEKLFYNGLWQEGVQLSVEEDMLPKQLVSMGAYLCVFPDGVYINTADLSDYGTMAAEYASVEGASVTFEPCRADGERYNMDDIIVDTVEPSAPSNGQYWLDTSGDVHALKQYSSTSGMWVQIPTVYVRIGAVGIGRLFETFDGVTLSGVEFTDNDDAVREQFAALNADCIIQGHGDDYIIVVGLIDRAYTQKTGQIRVERKVPKMQYVCESNNRLWGCFYGMRDGEMLNEIYACKLGDFKNWNCYMGISSDSYTVSIGTDGEFTGCIAFRGHPMFFKENHIHIISGSFPSNFQTVNQAARGVQRGSAASLQIVNEVLYYKSRSDVCAYDGSLPQGISPNFGTELYYNAVAGAHGGKYYISMMDASNAWHMFVYDTQRGLWHREDSTRAVAFAAWGDELYYIDWDTNCIMAENGTVGALESDVEWMAESGLIGYNLIDHEYISRFNFRMRLMPGSEVRLETEYDSDGVWHDQGVIVGSSTDSFIVPVIPRRCDHFRIRLSGRGDVKIYSLAKIIEQGSDHS